MALKINQSATFWWPVEVSVPVDGGIYERQTFDVQFARMGLSELTDLRADVVSGRIPDIDGFRALVKGWRGVQSDGQDLPFSDGNLQALVEIPGVGLAITSAYNAAIEGGAARRKN
jgi:hypothetical protein